MRRDVPALLPAVLVAAAVSLGLFFTALSGGSYDVVDRQTAGLVLWWAVGVGALVFGPPRRPSLPAVVGTAFAAGIVLWIATHISSSISHERTVIELGRAVTHLGPLVLIGWVLPQKVWRGVFAGLVVAAVAISVASLGQRLHPGFLGQTGSQVFGDTNNRLASPLGYWNAVGSWNVITALLLLAISTHHPRVWVRALAMVPIPVAIAVVYMTYSRTSVGAIVVGAVALIAVSKNRWTVAAHAGLAGLVGIVVIRAVRNAPQIAEGTGTAGSGAIVSTLVLTAAILAAAGFASGYFGLDRLRLPKRPALAAFAAGLVVAAAVGGVVVDRYGQKAWDQFNTTEYKIGSDDPTARLTQLNGTRIAQWRVAWDAYEANKGHGTGAGTFELVNNRTRAEFVRDAHNAYVESLAEQGLPGFLLLVGLTLSMAAVVVLAARRARTALDRGLVAGAAAGLTAFTFGTVVDWYWEVTALALLALGLFGVVMAASSAPRWVVPERADDLDPASAEPLAAVEVERPAARGGVGVAARGAVVVLALAAVLTELPVLVGTSEVRRSAADVATGDLVAARAKADEAIDIMYWASSPYLQRALVDEQAGDWPMAARSIRLAMVRDPQDWRLPLVLARIQAKAGRPQAALKAYRQAKALRPLGEFFR